jgi:hypothetical protein
MSTKKLGIRVGLAGAGVFAARSLAPKLHDKCQSMCAGGKCGGARTSQKPAEPVL